MARVVVIGAGMGGLAAAAWLADFGHQVTVLERAGTVGGRIGTYTCDGFTFDTSPGPLTLPAVYRDLFRKTGRPLERVLDLVPVDPAYSYRFADGTRVDLPNASRSGAVAAVDAALGAGAGQRWDDAVRYGGRVWEIARQRLLTAAATGTDLLGLAISPAAVRTLAPWRSLRAFGHDVLGDPRLRAILDRAASGADPDRVPAALAVVPYVEQTFGRWYVAGGMRRLVDAVHDRVRDLGADVRTGAPVAGVILESGRVAGVRLVGGQSLAADIVVSNAPAAHLYADLLPRPAARALRRRLARSGPSPSRFTLLLALHGRTSPAAHHTILFPDLPGRERISAPPDDPVIEVYAPDDPALRPSADSAAWTVTVAVPPHREGDEGERGGPPHTLDWTATGMAESYADHILTLMAARGLDVRDRLAWRVIRTPRDLAVATGAPGGSASGPLPGGAWTLARRPRNRSPVSGLFLVGGSAYPGPGLPLIGLSAAMVADLIGRA